MLKIPKFEQSVQLKHEFGKYRRIRLGSIIEESYAKQLHDAMLDFKEWNTVINSGPKLYELTPTTWTMMSVQQREELEQRVISAGRTGYQFRFDNHRLSDKGEPYAGEIEPFRSIVRAVNDEPFLEFAREISGISDIRLADVQITRYLPGHFLHAHDDVDEAKGRRMAFVLGLTTHWRPEWGGILNFMDADGEVDQGYVPSFNVMSLFQVGQPHFVSYVAPFATLPRLSVTGWLRAR